MEYDDSIDLSDYWDHIINMETKHHATHDVCLNGMDDFDGYHIYELDKNDVDAHWNDMLAWFMASSDFTIIKLEQ